MEPGISLICCEGFGLGSCLLGQVMDPAHFPMQISQYDDALLSLSPLLQKGRQVQNCNGKQETKIKQINITDILLLEPPHPRPMAMVIDSNLESGFPYWTSVRRRFGPDSPFFASGNIERELLAKQIALDLSEDEKCQLENMVTEDGRGVCCPIVGCNARLTSLEEFEDHYNARHTASCSVCSRVYPTSRLLSIHVSEAHDSFFQAKAARGYAMYECLVEGCGLKFKSYKGRQQHLVHKHKFPTSFEFLKESHPSRKQRQKNQRKLNIHKKEAMEIENETIDGLVSAVSKLSTSDSSPSSISFGRRHTRGLTFVPRTVQCERKADSTTTGAKR